MAEKNFGPFLGDEDVWAIAKQRMSGAVSLAALDCNWTGSAKVPGEKDYFNIWAVVSFPEKKDRVFLHGARFSTWNLEIEMKLVGTVKNVGLYRLSLENPNEFPNEFVLLLKREETGEEIYDNNNYRNYYIEHSKGHFATAVSHGGSVFSFDSIIPVKVIHV